MIRIIILFAMLAPATSPRVAFSQDPEARIEAARRAVAEAGIPTTLIDTRVAEGKAKGIPMERIAAVVERRAQLLASAQEAMAGVPGLTAADLAAGADALEAGIDRGSLRAVIQGARAQDRPVAIAVLTYLHREGGLPVGLALQRVRTAMGEGPDALRTLPGRAAAAAARGGPPPWAGPGVGGEAAGKAGAPPAAVPAPGERPGHGRPERSGRGISGGNSPGPGHSGTPPGKGGTPPGQDGTPPGQGGSNGQGGSSGQAGGGSTSGGPSLN
ncbi:MAG TPA: hypothetical protein VF167_00200 [Longimicrobiaceae bacterium]